MTGDSAPIVNVPWPFADPPDYAAYITVPLVDMSAPLAYVIHTHSGDWELHCDTTALRPSDVTKICLRDAVKLYPSFGALAKLPVGWLAELDHDAGEWVVSPADFPDD